MIIILKQFADGGCRRTRSHAKQAGLCETEFKFFLQLAPNNTYIFGGVIMRNNRNSLIGCSTGALPFLIRLHDICTHSPI